MPSLRSRGFKWSIGSLASLIGILALCTPYLTIVSKSDALAAEIKDLKQHQASELREVKLDQKVDHDTLIKLSTDAHYIKETLVEIKILLQQTQSKQKLQYGNP